MSEDKIQQLVRFLGGRRRPFSDEYDLLCRKCKDYYVASHADLHHMFGRVMMGNSEEVLWCQDCQDHKRAADLLLCHGEEEIDTSYSLHTARAKRLDALAADFGIARRVTGESDAELQRRLIERMKRGGT